MPKRQKVRVGQDGQLAGVVRKHGDNHQVLVDPGPNTNADATAHIATVGRLNTANMRAASGMKKQPEIIVQ
ncbi:MAG: hypothetical protein CM1200mP9_06420 [Gammaproteobacteria bacterium]|nr:MAG: hypothetical protein CM1200mP9_06420 [Gammaproteobacteria bacterium]